MLIRSSVAQYELLLRCKHFYTVRKGVYICFFKPSIWDTISQKPQSNINNYFNFSNIKVRFHYLQWLNMIGKPYVCLHIVFFKRKYNYVIIELFPQFPCFCSKVPHCSSGYLSHCIWHVLIISLPSFWPYSYIVEDHQ